MYQPLSRQYVHLQEPEDIVATYPELIGGLLSLAFCCWYYAKKHWLANNVLGICFSVEGIEHLSVGSVQTGAILLSGLFFYDIFWVFCTPVMVKLPTLATQYLTISDNSSEASKKIMAAGAVCSNIAGAIQ